MYDTTKYNSRDKRQNEDSDAEFVLPAKEKKTKQIN